MKALKVAVVMGCLAIFPLSQVTQAKITVVAMPMERRAPSDESLQKLAEVMQYDKSFDKPNPQLINALYENIQKQLNADDSIKNLTPEQNQKINQLFQAIILDFVNEAYSPASKARLMQTYKDISRKIYTQDEVNAMIEFYGSPIGKRITLKDEAFTVEVMKYAIALNQETQERFLREKFPDFKKEFEKIIKNK